MKCEKCNEEMQNLGNISRVQFLSNPVQWDDVWVCDKCKTKKTVREHGY